jgi:hypothetical protein
MRSQLKWMFVLFLTAILSAPAWAGDASTRPAVPGTLNYVEGKVSIGAQSVDTKAIGTAQLDAGQSLTTQKGKAEILLTPGVFLRVADNSSVKMVSTSLTDTEVALENGHAMIEVAEIHPENDIRVAADGKTTQLLKTGLYDFDASEGEVRVFEGKARVEEPNKHVDVKGGRELSLANQDNLKPAKFDKKSYDDGDLYKWSSLRSAYIAEANVDAAGLYAQNGWGPWGPGWWGAGWYWDPWFDGFTFIPADGIFYSPFGWGFYSPWYAYYAPFYVYGGYRYGGGRYVHHFSADYRAWGPGTHYVGGEHYTRGVYTGVGSSGGGFHSSGRMTGGAGGFAGRGVSGGGFHGGGFGGGGMHGGGSHGR